MEPLSEEGSSILYLALYLRVTKPLPGSPEKLKVTIFIFFLKGSWFCYNGRKENIQKS